MQKLHINGKMQVWQKGIFSNFLAYLTFIKSADLLMVEKNFAKNSISTRNIKLCPALVTTLKAIASSERDADFCTMR